MAADISPLAFPDYYKRPLSEGELNEIRANLVGFFSLLVEIDRENKEKSK